MFNKINFGIANWVRASNRRKHYQLGMIIYRYNQTGRNAKSGEKDSQKGPEVAQRAQDGLEAGPQQANPEDTANSSDVENKENLERKEELSNQDEKANKDKNKETASSKKESQSNDNDVKVQNSNDNDTVKDVDSDINVTKEEEIKGSIEKFEEARKNIIANASEEDRLVKISAIRSSEERVYEHMDFFSGSIRSSSEGLLQDVVNSAQGLMHAKNVSDAVEQEINRIQSAIDNAYAAANLVNKYNEALKAIKLTVKTEDPDSPIDTAFSYGEKISVRWKPDSVDFIDDVNFINAYNDVFRVEDPDKLPDTHSFIDFKNQKIIKNDNLLVKENVTSRFINDLSEIEYVENMSSIVEFDPEIKEAMVEYCLQALTQNNREYLEGLPWNELLNEFRCYIMKDVITFVDSVQRLEHGVINHMVIPAQSGLNEYLQLVREILPTQTACDRMEGSYVSDMEPYIKAYYSELHERPILRDALNSQLKTTDLKELEAISEALEFAMEFNEKSIELIDHIPITSNNHAGIYKRQSFMDYLNKPEDLTSAADKARLDAVDQFIDQVNSINTSSIGRIYNTVFDRSFNHVVSHQNALNKGKAQSFKSWIDKDQLLNIMGWMSSYIKQNQGTFKFFANNTAWEEGVGLLNLLDGDAGDTQFKREHILTKIIFLSHSNKINFSDLYLALGLLGVQHKNDLTPANLARSTEFLDPVFDYNLSSFVHAQVEQEKGDSCLWTDSQFEIMRAVNGFNSATDLRKVNLRMGYDSRNLLPLNSRYIVNSAWSRSHTVTGYVYFNFKDDSNRPNDDESLEALKQGSVLYLVDPIRAVRYFKNVDPFRYPVKQNVFDFRAHLQEMQGWIANNIRPALHKVEGIYSNMSTTLEIVIGKIQTADQMKQHLDYFRVTDQAYYDSLFTLAVSMEPNKDIHVADSFPVRKHDRIIGLDEGCPYILDKRVDKDISYQELRDHYNKSCEKVITSGLRRYFTARDLNYKFLDKQMDRELLKEHETPLVYSPDDSKLVSPFMSPMYISQVKPRTYRKLSLIDGVWKLLPSKPQWINTPWAYSANTSQGSTGDQKASNSKDYNDGVSDRKSVIAIGLGLFVLAVGTGVYGSGKQEKGRTDSSLKGLFGNKGLSQILIRISGMLMITLLLMIFMQSMLSYSL